MSAQSTLPNEPWDKIVELLHELPPNGPDGFEGVVATMLESLTGKPFFVAATGRQPLGDAISHDVRVSMQAKRYATTTALDANKVIADFHSARAAASYRLDVYVVAVTRETAQLRAELEPCQRDTGVDIIVLADDADSPELSALCVALWPQVKDFFSSIPADLKTWIEGNANHTKVQDAVARAKTKVSDGLHTFLDLRELARKRMARLFRSGNPGPTNVGVQIRLSDMVERHAPHEALLSWWAQEKEPNAFVEAEEGYGKSWVVAAFAEHLVAGEAAPIVLWAESLDWNGAKTLDEVVAASLRTVVPAGEPRADVYASKIFRVWPKPVLLVLDGVNEFGCLDSAQHLLQHYTHHSDHYPKHLRLLFTTRPLQTHLTFRPEIWKSSRRIPLSGFNDTEFNDALRRFAPEVSPGSIPPNVRSIAAVPRFFRIALRLRERLRDLGQLTKSVLLFADLIDKIDRDVQIRRLFRGSPEAMLAHLAKHSQRSDGGVSVVSHQHLAECFPDFTKALDDLAEQRIVLDQQIGKVVVNTEHVVLGFALHLLQIAEANLGDSEIVLRDRLATALEPNREDDIRTEALYVALLLSLLRDAASGQSWGKTRRALLFLWCGGHNARRTKERLSFWARTDLPAYRGMVEGMFTRYLSGGQDTDLVMPIAQRWVREGTNDEGLVRLLAEWLTLVWSDANPDDNPDEAIERMGYPKSETYEQLRLSFAAISILSLRPDHALLPALIRCARSCKFCEVTEEMNGKAHKVRLKSPYENLGILLRWNYTEQILPLLSAKAKALPDNQATQHGLWVLAECLGLEELPPELQRPKPQRIRIPQENSHESIIGGFHQWIRNTPLARTHMPSTWKLELLAEHPCATLSAEEIACLQVILSQALAKTASHAGRDEVDELFPHIFPWIARFAPAKAQQLSQELWSYAIRSTNPAGVAMNAPILPLLPSQLDLLFVEICAARDRFRNEKNLGAFLTRFSKVVLLSIDEAAIVRWFEVILELPSNYSDDEWRILPVPVMLEEIATPTLAEECWKRFQCAQRNFPEQPHDRRVKYWLTLYACLVRGDAAAGYRALALARTLPASHPWAETLSEIIAISGDATVVDSALCDPEFRRHFSDHNATHHFAWFLRLPCETRLSIAVQELLPQLPLTVAAELLRLTNGEHEHLSFARKLAEAALRRATRESDIIEPEFELCWTRAHNDHRAWWEIDVKEPESRTSHSALSSVWGVDRDNDGLRRWADSLNGNQDAAINEQNRRINDAIKRTREKMDAIADEFLVRFHGTLTLERWAALKPEEFREFARLFFATLAKNRMNYFDLSTFCDDVLLTMCTLDVSAADQLNDEFNSGSRGAVMINGIIPSFLFRIMSHELNQQEPAISKVRLKLLDRCRNDRDVLATVMAALHGGTINWMREQARANLGTSPLAKERALAVSLLAFAESPEDRAWLSKLIATDPSRWVRDHAKWAVAVHEQSTTARRLWDETVAEIQRPESDLLLISTMLVRLQPLLPPTASLWHRPQGSPRVNALVASFWYTWQNRSDAKAEREICGRRIKEYFRGERITDVAKRMAPWWQPF